MNGARTTTGPVPVASLNTPKTTRNFIVVFIVMRSSLTRWTSFAPKRLDPDNRCPTIMPYDRLQLTSFY